MNLLTTYLKDFTSLFFPDVCQACGNSLVIGESVFCTTCIFQFPYTDFHLDAENTLAKQFWGRIHIQSAVAFLYFSKGGKVQNIMHQLKYNKQPQVGIELGKMYGNLLKDQEQYKEVDAIIPVPLHPDKFKKRGYNQSEQFAMGLSEVMDIPIINDLLIRVKSAESQIKQSRSNRFHNIESVFETRETQKLLTKILLVDDTITTGATLEICTIALQKIGIKEINIVGIAFTQ
ncbi:MAG: ComF family protein [Bacteroidetes bacterium]|nr:ComF family protein [Bacteroidota bacterium]MBU1371846.1 ComF family protein [Bacteroidota bacterium]MBU1483269.1 ComF family protein [Bacteroidota bacterium]MBU1760319.1 ComF family protein [Bacteroidota bacterium]MBU2047185.1 ComF family protein [Bacteroidota bacterium]